MSDPTRSEIEQVLDFVAGEAKRYLASVDDAPLRTPNADDAVDALDTSLPEEGDGALQALKTLMTDGLESAINSTGPRFFHFVIGGNTPAALGADLLTSVIDQNPGQWPASPLGAQLAVIAIDWLRDLFDLPEGWGGSLTTGGTQANFIGLAAGRRWWAEEHGIDIDERGFADLPPVPVFSSGYIHASAIKTLGMLGIGRSTVRQLTRDDIGRLDLDALEPALRDLNGAPAIIIANAGEVNAGDFDPIEDIVELAEGYRAWVHVDGAFGLFARLSPRTAHLTEGVERAHSVSADGHKWLNVPQDCGFTFVRDDRFVRGAFASTAAYLSALDDPRPNLSYMGPQASQRARALVVWATLRAYGRNGYRRIVEGHLDLAQRVAERVDDAPDLERLAEVPLNIVCFRYRAKGMSEDELDELNRKLGDAVLKDGRVYVGTTLYGGRVAFRPAIVNWRTSEDDVDLLVDVVRELGARLVSA